MRSGTYGDHSPVLERRRSVDASCEMFAYEPRQRRERVYRPVPDAHAHTQRTVTLRGCLSALRSSIGRLACGPVQVDLRAKIAEVLAERSDAQAGVPDDL